MDYFDYGESSSFDVEEFLEKSQEQERQCLEKELDGIEEQLESREEIHQETLDELESKLNWYITRLNQLYKRGTGKQGERDRSKQVIDQLYKSIREEKRSNWLDQQELQSERRKVLRELEELDQNISDLLNSI